jgi:hypothetical protein
MDRRRNPRPVTGFLTVTAAGALLLAAGPASAQFGIRPQDQKQVVVPRPPTPRIADNPPTLWMFALAVVLGAAVAGASMIPSKRGHQD